MAQRTTASADISATVDFIFATCNFSDSEVFRHKEGGNHDTEVISQQAMISA